MYEAGLPPEIPLEDVVAGDGWDDPMEIIGDASSSDSRADPVEDQDPLERAMQSGAKLIFLTGKAGTGKTYAVKSAARGFGASAALVAPTGIAALNLGGQTINSFFRAPLTPISPDEPIQGGQYQEPMRLLQLLVVDEISMVRPDLLHYVDRKLRADRRSERPFGGLAVILSGDPFQLPTVVEEGDDAHFLDHQFGGKHFFNAPAWSESEVAPVELTHVFRQTDAGFIQILDSIRLGSDVGWALDQLHSQVGPRPEDALTLCATRELADFINTTKLDELPGESRNYEALIGGDPTKAELNNFQSPTVLRIKVGARVMFTQNDAEGRWVNGTLGTVSQLGDNGVRVALEAGGVEAEPATWPIRRLRWDPHEHKIGVADIGSFTQIPLMLAWATTVHKSQGLTLDRVHLDLEHPGWCHGLVYTALSRVRSLEDLTMQQQLTPAAVAVSESLKRWYERVVR
jgi:ATP-dependent DNA helicase PIF1